MKSTMIVFLTSVLLYSVSTFAQKSELGEWSEPISFGIVPVAVANLPDGRLLAWSSQFRNTFIEAGDGATFSQYFDPFGGPDGRGGVDGPEFTINTDHDMFCPGINNLADGRILSAGGTSSERTSIFDPLTGLWSVAAEMNIPRGYQGNVTLQDGNVFTVGGSWNDYNSNNPADPLRNGGKDAELWSPTTGWITLPNIQGEDIYTSGDLATEEQGLYRVDNHVWLWPAPNGKLFHAGPSEMMHWIDVDVPGGDIVEAGLRQDLSEGVTDAFSMKGNTVMFDAGKILKTGGAQQYGEDYLGTTPARDNSFVIDLNGVAYGDAPNVSFAGYMAHARTMHNSTVLPNGEVVVTGGLGKAALFTDDMAVYGAEIYNEDTGWRSVAAMQEARTYHSVAILMVDGRVFVGGGGLCDNTPDCVNHFSAETYSPPYLFDGNGDLATRPVITNVGSGNIGPYGEEVVDYNSTLSVTTDVPVSEFSLVRFSAATHATNNEQRRVPLQTTTGTSHSLSIPGRNLLPPGYYMLFAMDANGVPSIASTLQIGDALELSVPNPNEVLHFAFDENGGTTIEDTSGNGNDGTVVEREDDGTPRTADDHGFVAGLFGNALQLDGKEFQSNSIVDMPMSPSFKTLRDKVTISAWVYREAGSLTPNGKVANVGVLSHDYPANFFGFHNTLYKWSFATTNGFVDLYSGYAPLAGWNHIVGVYDGEVAKLYANGVEVASKAITGNLRWRDDGTDYSSVTTSGFYDHRYHPDENPDENPTDPDGNVSGITDELDGRIDELLVQNVALGPEEVAGLYQQGVAQNSPEVAVCEGNYIEVEYRINDGEWLTNEFGMITVQEGDEVFLRARDFAGRYFVTTQLYDGPTFDSDVFGAAGYQIDTGVSNGDGQIDLVDGDIYVLTTASGCPTPFKVDVSGVCDPGATEFFAEYRINNTWDSGAAEIVLQQGDNLQLSITPNPGDAPELYPVTIKLPNGLTVADNYTIDPIEPGNAGTYEFISAQGCSKLLQITVEETDCASLGLLTEYQLNGGDYITGQSSVEVSPGDDLRLSIVPNGTPFSIVSSSLNGHTKTLGNNDLIITDISGDDLGVYTFTTIGGCAQELEVKYAESNDCTGIIIPEYQLNGEWLSGENQLVVEQGTSVVLSMLPNGVGLSIELPNGTFVTDNHNLGNVDTSDSGTYVLYSDEGCEDFINLIVVDNGGNIPPTALAVSDVSNGIYPLTVDFVGSGSADDGSIVSYAWDFGDGSGSTVADPVHEYVSPGVYIAVLTVTDDDGLRASDSVEITVTDGSTGGCLPVATPWSGTDVGSVGVTGTSCMDASTGIFELSGSGSDIWGTLDGFHYVYQVLSGDGEIRARVVSMDNTHGWAKAGVMMRGSLSADAAMALLSIHPAPNGSGPGHTLQQRGSDGGNMYSSTEHNIGPVASGFPRHLRMVRSGSLISGYTSSDGSSWDLLGSREVAMGEDIFVGLAVSSHNNSVLNTAVFDNVSVQGGGTTVVNQPPTALAVSDVSNGIYPLTVDFVGSGSADDGSIVSYAWDFGDGSGSTVADPVHEYVSPGVYIAVLTVTDDDGLRASDSVEITVTDGSTGGCLPVATPWSGTDVGSVGVTGTSCMDASTGIFELSGSGSDIWGTLDGFHYVYQVLSGDGEIRARVVSMDNTHGWAKAGVMMRGSLSADAAMALLSIHPAPNGSGPGHTLQQRGSDGGNMYSSTEHNIGPVASGFPRHLRMVRSGSLISGYTSSDGSSWDLLGSREVAMGEDIFVGLAVSSHNNSVLNTAVFDNVSVQGGGTTVVNQPPTALAVSDVSNGIYPLTVDFVGSGSADDGSIVSYAWDFGDGSGSTVADPVHEYVSPGVYIAVLTVTDDDGLRASDSVEITVTDGSTGGCLPVATPWSGTDVGSVGVTGTSCMDASTGIFELSGSGSDIWGTLDGFHYVYQVLSGDGEIRARVVSMDNTHGWAKAGVMMRGSLSADAAMALLSIHPAPNGSGPGHTLQQRGSDGGNMYSSTEHNIGPVASGFPRHLRMVRSGSLISGYTSSDGSSWDLLGSREVAMGEDIFVGLAVSSHNNSVLNTAVFDNVSVIEPTSVQYKFSTNKNENFSSTSEGFRITPNPGSHLIRLSFDEAILEGVIRIFDQSGKLLDMVHQGKFKNAGFLDYNIETFPIGSYYITFEYGGIMMQKVLVVSRE